MMPFHGDKTMPRLKLKAGSPTFSWLFDTGAPLTCMYKTSFEAAFSTKVPKQISDASDCIEALGDKMS